MQIELIDIRFRIRADGLIYLIAWSQLHTGRWTRVAMREDLYIIGHDITSDLPNQDSSINFILSTIGNYVLEQKGV